MAGHHDRLVPCLILLTAFLIVRTLGELATSSVSPLDCELIAAADMTAMERCLTVRPADIELMAELGRAYERADRWGRAESIYRQALEVDVDDGDMRVRLGQLLLRRGDAVGARRQAEIAVALQPGRSGPRDLLRQTAIGGQPGLDR